MDQIPIPIPFPERPFEVTLAFGLLAVLALFIIRKPASGNAQSKGQTKYPLLHEELGSEQNRKEFVRNSKNLYREGYNKFKKTIFRIVDADSESIVLPVEYLDELRQLPDNQINSHIVLNERIETKYTKMDPSDPHLNHAIRADLTPRLNSINPRLGEEAERLAKEEIPDCDDWTPVNLQKILLRMVAIMSGNIFLGPDLCRRTEYLDASIMFTVDLAAAVRQMKTWRASLRWLASFSYFTPPMGKIKKHSQAARDFLVPIIQERTERMKNGETLPDDMLQWMLNKRDKFPEKDDASMAQIQLLLSMAAIHTTTATVLNVLYDLVANPDIIPALRDEIHSVFAEHGSIVTSKTLYDMKLLDSVMKESQRLYPLGFSRFHRKVLKDTTLRDGTHLPKHSYLEVATEAMSRDPAIYENPDSFDPYRYYHLREGGKQHLNRHQFVTITPENTNFGWGRHACPGRFFAANEIKLILANILLNYDLKMKDEDVGKGRFANIEFAIGGSPDPTKEILLRRVQA